MEFQTNPPNVGDRIYTFQGTATRKPQLILAEVVGDRGHKSLDIIKIVSGGQGGGSPDDDANLHLPDTGIYCYEKDGPLGHY
jgi:hypothetical protein